MDRYDALGYDEDQAGNSFAPLQIPNDNNSEQNIQHIFVDNVGMSNTNVNTVIPTSPVTPVPHNVVIPTSPVTPIPHNVAIPTSPVTPVPHNVAIPTSPITPVPQNAIFEFYLLSPNDGRIYYVTYKELHPIENTQILNNSIHPPHIPDYQIPHYCNMQPLIHQQVQQRIQQPYYQQNNTQQSFNNASNQSTPQVYLGNNTCNSTSISINGAISNDVQDTRFQNSQNSTNIF